VESGDNNNVIAEEDPVATNTASSAPIGAANTSSAANNTTTEGATSVKHVGDNVLTTPRGSTPSSLTGSAHRRYRRRTIKRKAILSANFKHLVDT
jgi:hypothetical protein